MAQSQILFPANFGTDEQGRPIRPTVVLPVGTGGAAMPSGSSTDPTYTQPATSGTTPVTQSFTATGSSALFQAVPGHAIWVKISGTFVGTVIVERCSDGTTATAAALTVGGSTYASFTAPCQEAVSTEDDTGVAYRVRCTSYTSGTINTSIGHK